MPRGQGELFKRFQAFKEPYVRGLKPFSSEYFAAQKRASAAWHAEHPRSNPDDGYGGVRKINGLAAVAGAVLLLVLVGNAISQAKKQSQGQNQLFGGQDSAWNPPSYQPAPWTTNG